MHLHGEQIAIFFIILFIGMCLNAHSNVAYEFLLADGRYGIVATLLICGLILFYGSFEIFKTAAGPYAIAWAWVISQALYALTADELVMLKQKDALHTRIKVLSVKSVMILMTILCLMAKLDLKDSLNLWMTLVLFVLGLLYISKDFLHGVRMHMSKVS